MAQEASDLEATVMTKITDDLKGKMAAAAQQTMEFERASTVTRLGHWLTKGHGERFAKSGRLCYYVDKG